MREEKDVHAHEHQPEVQLSKRLRIHVPEHLRVPVVPAGEDGEDGTHREHVVEVRHDVVGVVELLVKA